MSITRKLAEQELGRISFRLLEEKLSPDHLAQAVDQKALSLLQTICDILDNDSLSDFDCVEALVCALEEAGIPTSRHDFG